MIEMIHADCAACKRYKDHAVQETLFDNAELTKQSKQVELIQGGN